MIFDLCGKAIAALFRIVVLFEDVAVTFQCLIITTSNVNFQMSGYPMMFHTFEISGAFPLSSFFAA